MRKLEFVEQNLNEKSVLLRRIGAWGLAFFVIKGVFWMLFTAALAWFGMN